MFEPSSVWVMHERKHPCAVPNNLLLAMQAVRAFKGQLSS